MKRNLKLKRSIKIIGNRLNTINIQINDVSTFYLMISKYKRLKQLSRDDIVSLIDKIIIRERKGNNKKRLVEIHFALIGKM